MSKNQLLDGMKDAPKVMPPILLCWPMTSETDVDGMAIEIEPSLPYSVTFYSHKSLHQVVSTEYHEKSTLTLPRQIEMS